MSHANQKFLITGGAGMLAQALARVIRERGVESVAMSRAELDISNPEQVSEAFAKHQPTVVLNTAAYTKVDLAETETERAEAVNGKGPQVLSLMCADHHAKLVHFSTDFVFDGKSTLPYRPSDATNPLSAYGRTKLSGERKLRPNDLNIRTAWLYGPGGACFPQTILNAARAGKPLRVVSDQTGTPTFTRDLAEATLALLDADAQGRFHFTNFGQTTWFDFTRAILDEFKLTADLQPISSADWQKIRPNTAVRPAYSVLDTSDFTRTTGKTPRDWREALHEYRIELGS
jgi:dTDP-4-dehydrorhamnose reductase